MVGAINAPASGNTLEAFVEKAKTVLAASIPPKAPIGGVVTANGTQIATFNGNVLNVQVLDKGVISHVPKPGDNTTEAISGMAGGSQPLNYGWGETLSPAALEHLEVLLLIDNAILDGLWDGFDRLKAGNAWAGVWPPAIVSVIGGAAAQALVHRTTLTDALQHFNQGVKPACRVSFPTGSIDEWLAAVQNLLTLQFTVVRRSDGFATVPANMYGTLWAVLTTKQNVKLQEVADVAVAGPEPIWVADPSS